MATVELRELRQDAADLVRRVERGEEVDITVAGRLVARMVRPALRRWQRWDVVAAAFSGAADPDWERDRELIDQSIVNPWERADDGGA
jgi:antitoxin (DNA-binding transcriptional repressor) of toxin-antitoxin stability system